jgi:CxxC motif-containing protein
MKIINSAKPCLPILAGDVIIEDIFGAKLVATQSVE